MERASVGRLLLLPSRSRESAPSHRFRAGTGSMPGMDHGAPAKMSKDELTAFAKVQIAIMASHDSIGAEMAMSGNKK